MANHSVSIHWQRIGQDFNYETYDRTYTIKFSGGTNIQASNPKDYFGKSELPNPEELLMSALSGCYMQTFLAVACKNGYIIDNYFDDAIGITNKNELGKISVTEITLHPKIKFGGSKLPDDDAITKMREKAHANCFISNSINSQVNIEITAS
ncbi:OsmC family protein [Legionella longbeachae]|uniref:OsmC-like protein (Osmotically inducible protein C) n=1 Tax=Legionella longbeachae serogroup 1 (strain NSW150) TaxID=661367 RepID=D3HLP2_LEGLN|nr:OsmC family protein [Legionella longbeachae]VEE03804.1 OsmC-like protein (Osmotically inducible protein C) [Legionella oakridgensis]ARB93325.1 osmotically inducible protein OsmC [Legionella longbeachae]ARM33611.1 OsmC family peroxiredoxin [Legionella longbeachae]EEZ93536.1 OsmC family protein [Legionella longbeachae D-4968]RZV20551.1 OsmC family peroxiredoxin [Legionella longbeachae]